MHSYAITVVDDYWLTAVKCEQYEKNEITTMSVSESKFSILIS